TARSKEQSITKYKIRRSKMESIDINSSEHNGLKLHLYNTDKFKTISLMLTMKVPLQKSLTTARALIPYIKNDETTYYSKDKIIKIKIDVMYGSTLYPNVQKKENYHIISFRM